MTINVLPILPNPFVFEPVEPDLERFVIDEADFMAMIETPDDPLPAFLSDPSPEYMSAMEIIPLLKMLAGHASRHAAADEDIYPYRFGRDPSPHPHDQESQTA